MLDWWSSIGEASVWTGAAIGISWAVASTASRRRKYLKAAMPPFGQLRWFLLNLFGMGCFITLGTALGLASIHGLIPQGLFWFLLCLSAAAFITALLFPSMETPLPSTIEQGAQKSPADPPDLPIPNPA